VSSQSQLAVCLASLVLLWLVLSGSLVSAGSGLSLLDRTKALVVTLALGFEILRGFGRVSGTGSLNRAVRDLSRRALPALLAQAQEGVLQEPLAGRLAQSLGWCCLRREMTFWMLEPRLWLGVVDWRKRGN